MDLILIANKPNKQANKQFNFLILHSLILLISMVTYKTNKTPWPLVRERTIPTDRPPLVDEI
jgi:hypothetical protein